MAEITRHLAGILAADVVGYSAMIGADEGATMERVRALRNDVIAPLAAAHEGRVFKTTGDGFLVAFASAVQALRCAVAIQDRLLTAGDGLQLRIGVHQGEVVPEGDDLLGDGVIVAARIEPLAEPGGICISNRVREDAAGKVKMKLEDLGEPALKNLTQKIRVFRVLPEVSATPVLALPDIPSIAVLPFQNMSGDPEQEYFADGMVEEIITALSRFRQLFVIARNSSFTYKGRAVDVKQVGRELGVRYVLEGSVRKAASRVRITGQLIDAATGAHLWADRFDGNLDDIFELQDQVTASVVGAIAPTLEKAEIERVRRKPTDSLDAYDCFLQGMASYHQIASREAVAEAFQMFSRAIALDSGFASAYAMAAYCTMIRKASGWRTDPAKETADGVRLARLAVDLAKDDATALAFGGSVLAHLGRDLDAGIDFINRALALNPNLMMAQWASGWSNIWDGEPGAAIEHFTRAMRLSPLDPLVPRMRSGIAHAHFFAGRYDQASSLAATVLREMADYHDGLRISAASNAMAGRFDDAAKVMARLRQLDPALRVSSLREIQGPYRRTEDFELYRTSHAESRIA